MSNAKTKPAAFDFDALDLDRICDEPVEFELVHPETKVGLGVFLSVVGSESATFQTYLRAEQNRERRKAFEAERKGKADAPTPIEDDEDRLIRAVVSCVKGWRTVVDGESKPVILWGGEEYEFTTENAVKWMKRFRWVRPQVNEQTGELGNFIKG